MLGKTFYTFYLQNYLLYYKNVACQQQDDFGIPEFESGDRINQNRLVITIQQGIKHDVNVEIV